MVKAPFPYAGGKSTVADKVWSRFGDVANYVEPFAGSLAVLLARPSAPKIETVNDKECHIANFWRALKRYPYKVSEYATNPVNEADLHARHSWLLNWATDSKPKIMGDPDYCDYRAAGYWVWGISCWIGHGWCSGSGPWKSIDGLLIKDAKPGCKKSLPHLGDAGQGVTKQLPHLGDAGQGDLSSMYSSAFGPSDGLLKWMHDLAARLRFVRVCCGDWSRICGPSVTTGHGMTGVFLDPPYMFSGRDTGMYSTETDCTQDVIDWCVANAQNPLLRICVCGYEHQVFDALEGWECILWKANGGYGNQGNGRGRQNKHRERMYFSPACLKTGLFDDH